MSADELVSVRANECGVRAADVRGRSTAKRVVRVRAWIAAELRSDWELSLQAIGRLLGGRHHTTVMSYLGLIEK